MRTEINSRLVERNRKIANLLSLVSFAVIIVGFFVTNPQLVGNVTDNAALGAVASITALLVTFVVVVTAVRMTNTWVREPRPEKALKEGLKGLSNKNVLYSYYHKQASHILVTPASVFAIVTRAQSGRYSVHGDTWRSHKNIFSRLVGLLRFDNMGNPGGDAEKAASRVRNLLAPITNNVPVQPVVVFLHPKATLEIVNPRVPVVYADSKRQPCFKDYIRGVTKKQRESPSATELTPEQMSALEKAILPD